MAYPQLPERPPVLNPYQIVGGAATDLGSEVQQFGKNQDQLAENFQAMLARRAQAAQAAEDLKLKQSEDARQQGEYEQKQKTEEKRQNFLSGLTGVDKTDPTYEPKLRGALTAGLISASDYKDLLVPDDNKPIEVGGGLYKKGPDGKYQTLIAPKPNGFAGVTRAQISVENNLRGHNSTDTKDYDTAKRAALAFNADYDNYKAQLASGNKEAIRVAQQGMLDKYITASTNKSTGDAQFKNFLNGQGLNSTLDNLYQKVVNGSMAPDIAIRAMRDITMKTAMTLNNKVKQTNASTQKQVDAENKAHDFVIDPTGVITHPSDMLSQDSVAYAQPSFDNSAPQGETKTFRGVTYVLPPGKDRKDPKNWIPQSHE